VRNCLWELDSGILRIERRDHAHGASIRKWLESHVRRASDSRAWGCSVSIGARRHGQAVHWQPISVPQQQVEAPRDGNARASRGAMRHA